MVQLSTTPDPGFNGKVTNSQLDTTYESQEVSPFPAGDHKAHINRHAKRQSKHKTEKTYTIHKRSFGAVFASKGYPFKNIFDFTTAGDWDCVAAVERLPSLHFSVYFIACPLGSWVSLWNFETIRGSLMKPKWQKLASLVQ